MKEIKELPDTTGNRIKKAREARGLSQIRLGLLLGISQQKISRIEKHDDDFYFSVAKKIKKLLGMSWNKLALEDKGGDNGYKATELG